MKHSSPRGLACLLFMAGSIATACSLQVPDEDKVFSNNAVGSGGIAGNGGNSLGTGGTARGGTSSTANGGNAGVGGTAFTSGGLAGSSSVGGTGANVGGVGPSSGGGSATGGKTGVGGTVSGGATNNTTTAGSPTTGGAAPGGTSGTTVTGGASGIGGATGGTTSIAGGNNGTGGTTNAGGTGGALSGGGTTGGNTAGPTGGTVATGGSSIPGGAASLGGSGGTGGTTSAPGTGGSPNVLTIGLIHYYRFDETTGTVALNSIDSTKNGTYMGNSTHVVGRFGRAVGFRNAAAPPDYVELAPGLLAGLAATTISLWVADYSTSRRGARAFDFGTGDPTNIFFIPHMSNPSTQTDGALVSVRLNGLTNVQIWDNVNIADSNSSATIWHHMAVTWSVDALNYYIDGVLIGTQASPGVLPSDLSPTAANWLGRTFGDTASLMYASLDDLRIYDRVLPLTYIQNLYNML